MGALLLSAKGNLLWAPGTRRGRPFEAAPIRPAESTPNGHRPGTIAARVCLDELGLRRCVCLAFRRAQWAPDSIKWGGGRGGRRRKTIIIASVCKLARAKRSMGASSWLARVVVRTVIRLAAPLQRRRRRRLQFDDRLLRRRRLELELLGQRQTGEPRPASACVKFSLFLPNSEQAD